MQECEYILLVQCVFWQFLELISIGFYGQAIFGPKQKNVFYKRPAHFLMSSACVHLSPSLLLHRTLIKKEIQIFLIYKEIQNGAVPKSYSIWLTASSHMVKYLRISSYIRKPFLIYLIFFFISVSKLYTYVCLLHREKKYKQRWEMCFDSWGGGEWEWGVVEGLIQGRQKKCGPLPILFPLLVHSVLDPQRAITCNIAGYKPGH